MEVNPVASSVQVHFSAFFAGLCSNSFKRRGLSSQRIISILLWLKKKKMHGKVWSRHCSLEASVCSITMNVYSIASNSGAVNDK